MDPVTNQNSGGKDYGGDHYGSLRDQVDILLESGETAVIEAWVSRRGYTEARTIDTSVRAAQLKTFGLSA